eukprot:scaffold18809_cov102-Isochrysis_galbana.AAC.5
MRSAERYSARARQSIHHAAPCGAAGLPRGPTIWVIPYRPRHALPSPTPTGAACSLSGAGMRGGDAAHSCAASALDSTSSKSSAPSMLHSGWPALPRNRFSAIASNRSSSSGVGAGEPLVAMAEPAVTSDEAGFLHEN